MFPSTRVGWSGLSCFSLAICGPGAHGCREGPITRTARTTSKSNSCSTAPSSLTRVLQHLRAHDPANGLPYGSYGRAEAVRALTHAHSVCGPRRQWARALDAPVPPRPLYSDHPTPAPPAQYRQVSMGWQMQQTSRAGREATSRANVYEINQWL